MTFRRRLGLFPPLGTLHSLGACVEVPGGKPPAFASSPSVAHPRPAYIMSTWLLTSAPPPTSNSHFHFSLSQHLRRLRHCRREPAPARPRPPPPPPCPPQHACRPGTHLHGQRADRLLEAGGRAGAGRGPPGMLLIGGCLFLMCFRHTHVLTASFSLFMSCRETGAGRHSGDGGDDDDGRRRRRR